MTPALAAVAAQVTNLDMVVTAIEPLDGQSLAVLAPAILAAEAANAAIDAAILSTDLTISTGNYLGVFAGGNAPALAAQFLAQLTIMQNMSALLTMKGVVGRLGFNLSGATG